VTLTAQWRQNSLFGISDSDLSTASTLAFTTGGNINRTISFDDGISSATVRVPFNAFSKNVDVNVQALTDTNFAKNKVDASKSFPINLVVSWLATDGTVPTASNALTLTINNPSIKAGSTAYQIIGDDVTALGTAIIDGQIVVSLTSDPVISVTNDIVSNNNNDNGGGSSSNVVASAAKSVVSSIQTSLFKPSLTVYSASPRFSLDTLTKLKLKKYAKKQKKNSSITCIGYIYPNTKSTKTTKLATAQATNVCKYLKTQNKTLKTIIEIKSAKTAPIAAPGARWITTSYRVDGVLVRAL
jgi:formiminotetrahydrofolate cyclodeaminase